MTPNEVDNLAVALAQVLARHLKIRADQYERNIHIAEGIMVAYLNGENHFGLTVDTAGLERIIRSTRSIFADFESLSYATRREMRNLQEGLSLAGLPGEDWEPGALEILLDSLETFQSNLEIARAAHSKRRHASAKRNWRAIAVTDMCVTIWREDRWNFANRELDIA